MASSTSKSLYWQGVRDGLPFLFVVAPFAVLFGVLATEAGLSILETLTFSLAVVAGAAQFTALQLMQENTPTIVVLASALAVNLRLAMYSAALAPYLGAAPLWQRALAAYVTVDQSYACAFVKFENEPELTLRQRLGYFFGCVTPVCPMWYLFTLVGALIGTRIPEAWALDFALPITFLALITPMLRTAAHVIAAVTAIVVALLCVAVPLNLGLIIAGFAGMLAGARAEVFLAGSKFK